MAMVSTFLLKRRLAEARKRLDKAIKTLDSQAQGWREEYRAASEAVLLLERELAAALGLQYAVPLDFPVKWDTGAPCPHVVQSDYRTFLAFLVGVPDPNWDGTYAKAVDLDSGNESVALVEFKGCSSVRFGTPNDEVFRGHPLWGWGMQAYSAQLVKNSKWVSELEAINRVHHGYSPENWRDRSHYIFWFHDSTFECVADSYKVEVFREPMKALLERMAARCMEAGG